jgi:hypothetical protein
VDLIKGDLKGLTTVLRYPTMRVNRVATQQEQAVHHEEDGDEERP